ncbi:MAG TPA: FAD-dependent thymidylate synthase [bacterium]|nr:FAD-dependent thymidylate synthase [bacterium]
MAKIFIFDEFNPEDNAMLQALYSRSASSVIDHVEKVRKCGSGKFMETFYLGYGHSSIADCGSTTIFIEKLSILADKSIQDWPLYSGQETSTRYIDMSKQEIIDPLNNEKSKEILNNWMKFYIGNQESVKSHIRSIYSKKSDEDENIYQRAINARCFDIMRGFLPAGITTQLSWHTNLRQASDKLLLMQYHPIEEVRNIAKEIWNKLKEKYSHSFSDVTFEEQENYRKYVMQKYSYYKLEKLDSDFAFYTDIKHEELKKYIDLFNKRSIKTGLPHFLTELGVIRFDFLLDFGSFRDLQRHRNGVCRMPLLTTEFGFNEWYLSQLPDDLRIEAENLIKNQKKLIDELDTSEFIKQYYISLGFNVTCRVAYGLPAACYVTELRSGKSVHPTLRNIAHKMTRELLNNFPEIKLQSDLDKDDWDIRRGTQDIKEK